VDSESVAEAVIRSTPLLETFGNSKTLRNNNSSRFGKFTQVLFDREGSIVGSRVDVYLLEKSRVVHQLVGERNYHVFYQLLGAMEATLPGAPKPEGEEVGLYDNADAGGDGDGVPPLSRVDLGLPELGSTDDAAQFQFLAGSECYTSEGIDDAEWFAEMIETMSVIGITTAEQQQMVRVIAAVMQVGQISFDSAMGADGNDKAVVVGGEESPSLCLVSKLLSCSPADLQAVLETRQISARTETYTVNLNKSEAEAARDALGKALYDKLFAWIVTRINKSTAPVEEEKVAATIGVLDIFGFESFGTNSLEQLLINFANEKLQQQFTWYVFKLEQQEYEKEGIVWNPVDFKDNQPILDVLEGHNSVLALLDEECRLQNGSDDTFVEKLRKQAKRLPKVAVELGAKPVSVMTFPKMSKEPMFILRHYAGEVNYSADSFREKNKDSVHPDMLELVQHGSTDTFINNLFPEDKPQAKAKGGRGGGGRSQGGRKMVTLGSSFKEQLTSLVKVINSTTVHYVRCIKPNFEKSTDAYDLAGVSSQLRCQGILEAIRISRAAYPNRLAHAALLKRFQMCLRDATLRIEGASERSIDGAEGDAEQAKALLAHLKLDPSLPDGNYQIGNTKCFFRREAMEALEAARGRVIGGLVICVQAEARGWLTRRRFARMKLAAAIIQRVARGLAARAWVRRHRAAVKLQAATRSWLCRSSFQRQKAAAITFQCCWRVRTAKRRLFNARRDAAATCIQSRQRSLVKRRQFQKLRDATIVCQREGRRTLCRLRFIAMVEEARQEAQLSSQVERLQQALAESEEARMALEGEVTDLKRQLATETALREHSETQLSEGVPPAAAAAAVVVAAPKPMVPSGGPPKAVVKAVASPRPAVPKGGPPSPRVPAGGPPKVPGGAPPKVPSGAPPKPVLPAGGPPKVPAGGPPKVPVGGPPKPGIPAGKQPTAAAAAVAIPAGKPPTVPSGGPPPKPPQIPAGGPPSPPPGGGGIARQGSVGAAGGLAAVIKLENEVASLRKKLDQQKKSYEDALKRKDEKLKKIEKQQADAITKQAKAFGTANDLTKENEALQSKMQHFVVIKEERDRLKQEKAQLEQDLEEEKEVVADLSGQVADLEQKMERLEKERQNLAAASATAGRQAGSGGAGGVLAKHTANQVEGPTPEEALEHAKKAASRWASNLFAEKKQDQQQTKKTKFGGFGKKQAGAPGGQGRGGPGGAGAVASKRPRYPYSVYEYFPDEQKVFEEDESSATIEITATGQQLLVDKPSRMVFTMDEEPVEIGMWIEYAKQAH
jgi:myosin heavy subunit